MIEGRENSKIFLNDVQLLPGASQKVYNHSPDGFAWGYAGSGPAQLALALLLALTTKTFALNHYQQFKFDVIAKLPVGNFKLKTVDVRCWARDHGWDGGTETTYAP